MGKRGKKNKQPRHSSSKYESIDDPIPSSAYDPSPDSDHEQDDRRSLNGDPQPPSDEDDHHSTVENVSKFHLYQRSVQSPKGDISYLLKFFLMYVGGRVPMHLQEDFCGTALLSTEWLRADPRRTAVGLDLDCEALTWCLENNLDKIEFGSQSRIMLFHGNVLQPHEACFIRHGIEDLMTSINLEEENPIDDAKSLKEPDSFARVSPSIAKDVIQMRNYPLPARDIVCAFNYSCCCLHKRSDLVLYFRHALDVLSPNGGIFVMDVYGGSSSEHSLQLRRKLSDFTYIWEQAEFDVINRKTRISIHFQPRKSRIIRHAFSYDWRLWSLPEIKDCMEEAGFQSVHFWIREMPDTQDIANAREYNAPSDAKYEELSTHVQSDAWNAYVVGVRK